MRIHRRTIHSLVATLALVAIAGPVAASTALDRMYGTPLEGATTRSLAMGSVGVADLQGSSAAIQNPALLANFGGKAHLDFQVGIQQVNEDRFVPLYDTFDDLVAETAYVINRDTYASGQGGLLYRLPMNMPSVLSVGLFERYDFEWDYVEEVRSNVSPDPIEREREVRNDGKLRSWTMAYGTEIISSVNLGFAVHRYFGQPVDVRVDAPVNGADSVLRLERELSGWGFTVGAQVEPSPRVSFGASVESPVKLEGTHTLGYSVDGTPTPQTGVAEDGDYTLEYPATVAFGFTFHPRNELKTTFSVEARRRFWEDLKDDYLDATLAAAEAAGATDVMAPHLRDTWDFRAGVEHEFYNGTPLRFGFRYLENYADTEAERVIFSAGTGYVVGGVRIDVSGQYHRQTSRQEFVFDEGAAGISNPSLLPKVEDSVIRLVLGLSRSF